VSSLYPKHIHPAEGCSGYGGERDVDCGKTYGNGYQAVLLLPPLSTGVFGNTTLSDSAYPYAIDSPYRVVEYSMTRGMVMVPIATAFAIIAMLMFIFGSYRMTAWADWVIGLSIDTMSLC
jgi:hypothetical protein